jgi:hypothetical protein
MSALQIFVTPEELDELLKRLASAHGLSPCHYEDGRFDRPTKGDVSCVLREGRAVGRLFLVPEKQGVPPNASSADIRPRELGWLDVAPGQFVPQENGRAILTLTTIQAEDKSHLPFKPTSWLRSLRKLSGSFRFGVRGTNVAHGGSSDYKSMGYSRKALALHEQGVLWKYQVGDNTVFEPLEPASIDV